MHDDDRNPLFATLPGWSDRIVARPDRRSADESGVRRIAGLVGAADAARYELHTRSSVYSIGEDMVCLAARDAVTGERAHLNHIVGQHVCAGFRPAGDTDVEARPMPWPGARAVLIDANGRVTHTSRVLRIVDRRVVS